MPKPQYIDDHTIKCSLCNEAKPLDKFTYSTNKSRPGGYYFSFCKMCRYNKNKNNPSRITFTWGYKLGRIKQSATASKVPFKLTSEYLEELYNKQNGRCVYTHQLLRLSIVGRYNDTVSVDQIVPRGGYVPGNVVLCTSRANSIKQDQTLEELAEWMPLWHQRLQEFLND